MADKKNNTGTDNSGNWNSGYWNRGNWNSGDGNSGYWNSGYWNSGYGNSGDRNSGNWNSGDRNSGDGNSGDWNSGDRNSGNWNSGDWKSGYRNSGFGNSGNRNSGFFCTETPSPLFFDKPTNLSWEDALTSIPSIDLPCGCTWIETKDMSSAEKTDNPTYKTAGGYLKVVDKPITETFPLAWAEMSAEEKAKWTSLPNFDAEKFFKITGV